MFIHNSALGSWIGDGLAMSNVLSADNAALLKFCASNLWVGLCAQLSLQYCVRCCLCAFCFLHSHVMSWDHLGNRFDLWKREHGEHGGVRACGPNATRHFFQCSWVPESDHVMALSFGGGIFYVSPPLLAGFVIRWEARLRCLLRSWYGVIGDSTCRFPFACLETVHLRYAKVAFPLVVSMWSSRGLRVFPPVDFPLPVSVSKRFMKEK